MGTHVQRSQNRTSSVSASCSHQRRSLRTSPISRRHPRVTPRKPGRPKQRRLFHLSSRFIHRQGLYLEIQISPPLLVLLLPLLGGGGLALGRALGVLG